MVANPMPESFYRVAGGGRYDSSAATAGPWSPEAQHAGPPSALLGRVLERCFPRPDLRIARITLELPRPIPVGPIEVDARVVRSGTRGELLEGRSPRTASRCCSHARGGWSPVRRTRRRCDPGASPPPVPEPQPPHGMAGAHVDGYLSAMEWRFAFGGTFERPGPGTAWIRQRIPLVAGEHDTPLTRALTVADSNWAVAFELDHTHHFVINTDVTLALHRDPVGEWLCLRSATSAAPQGSGLAHGYLDDAEGECGHVLQTLLVAER